MKKPDYLTEVIFLILLLIPMVYLGLIWPSLPEILPSNFDAEGAPQRIGSKNDFLLVMIFLFLTNLLLYFLFRYLPKESDTDVSIAASFHRKYYRIRWLIHLYLALFTCMIIFIVSQGRPLIMERWAFVGVGALIVVLGGYLRRLEPNYFVGVRTPWTLKDDNIWKQTHAMAGTLWLCTGIVIIVAGFFLPLVTGVFLIIVVAALLAALPYIYSFRLDNEDKG
ncbi:SdpI family protein [Chitinophaga pendula]|uniref:SdpI family protein n=1 Tax=Chitinophaga TaxID=79328 RepID=UPI000BAEBF41|nr:MULTISPECIES: SdpI family protein [Chitinophaga]ASZ14597.1 hypothetical protein CK934_28410 [Chitinophaga sp. MD30]UCJ07750.1 SdpI family protein [Chitinophaga pendula]